MTTDGCVLESLFMRIWSHYEPVDDEEDDDDDADDAATAVGGGGGATAGATTTISTGARAVKASKEAAKASHADPSRAQAEAFGFASASDTAAEVG